MVAGVTGDLMFVAQWNESRLLMSSVKATGSRDGVNVYVNFNPDCCLCCTYHDVQPVDLKLRKTAHCHAEF